MKTFKFKDYFGVIHEVEAETRFKAIQKADQMDLTKPVIQD